ncbi:hypothetical protein DL93DRAFT_56731 [Clavulina sp. PMI_390]|nr:hypothetical protein DL93DRAFT_56731 [Clavulina sp. PMI_390]
MSSSLHYTEDALRRQRACDACRRRKSKCRPSEIDKARCKACVESKISKCTYVAPTGRAEPTFAYVRQLEDRIESLDLLLQKYVIADKERGKDPGPTSGGAAARSSQNVQVLSQRPFQVLPLQVSPPPPRYSEVDEYSWSSTGRHFGDSSWASLVGLAYEVRNDAVPGPPGPPRRLLIRDENEYSWESETNLQDDLLVFSKLPDDSQLQNLLGIYFRHVAPFFPIIHKATLEVQCADHLHRRHVSQARLILMMCAVASIYDPESNKTPGRHPPGWEFFSIMRHRQTQFTISGAARLLDAQILALQVLYHWQAGAIHSSWIVLGSGIRLAQEVGVQEPGFAMSRGPLEAEMWKRVLWFFIYQDRFLCTILGQTELIRGEFLELELPEATLLETQNEEATTVDYFRAQLQLSQPVGLSVRLQLGSVAMFKLWGFSSKEAITEELDGTLEDWVASLPPELKWVPDTPSVVALEQAAELDAALCFARILTRDPLRAAAPTSTIFLLGPEDDAGRAAERVINVLEVLLARSPGYWSFPIAQAVAFSSLVIETRLWAAERRVDVPTDIVKTMKRLHSSALHIMNQLAARYVLSHKYILSGVTY